MSIVLQGSTSGSVTLQEPAVAGTTVLTLPAVSGTVLTDTSPKAGNVLQVVSATYSTNVNISTTSWTSTGITASITPTSASNKVFIAINNPMRRNNSSGVDYGMGVAIYRNNSTSIFTGMTNLGYTYTVGNMAFSLLVPLFYLDSPATTSSTAYTMYFNCASNGTMSSCVDGNVATITLMEIAA